MNKQNDQQPEILETAVNKTNKSKTAQPQIESSKTKIKHSLTNKNMLIATLASCIAILGSVGAIGFTIWKTNYDTQQQTSQSSLLTKQLKDQQQTFQQWMSETKEQQTLLKTQLANEQAKVTELTDQLAALNASQQNVVSKVSKISTDSSQTWMLFETKQLLKQAFLRLRVSDINGASKLLEDVNHTIKQRGDLSQAASQINQSIETALLKLKQVEQVDRASIYSQLAALQAQISYLETKKPIFIPQSEDRVPEDTSRWKKLSNTLSSYVRINFNANNKALPLLTNENIGQLKMSLSLSIDKAQWAAINAEPTIYTAELNRIEQLLSQYFDTHTTQVSALISKINILKAKAITVNVPDISDTLIAVNNYLDKQINLKEPPQTTIKGGNE